MRFVALDVETANRSRRSICQVGVVVFSDGREVASELVLVDPQEEFDPINVSIHGIGPDRVTNAMTFPQLYGRLAPILGGHHVVSHSSFDRVAMTQATKHHNLSPLECKWLDSHVASRHAWPDIKDAGGFGLDNLSRRFGIPLDHHNALSDARAAGVVMLRAMAERGGELDHWAGLSLPQTAGGFAGSRRDIERGGDGDGPLFGESIVFTGNFTVDKYDLADMAHIAGAAVRNRVTRQTTMVVVGFLDPKVVGPTGKSTNLRKAEELAAGRDILFVIEDDFRELVRGPGGCSRAWSTSRVGAVHVAGPPLKAVIPRQRIASRSQRRRRIRYSPSQTETNHTLGGRRRSMP